MRQDFYIIIEGGQRQGKEMSCQKGFSLVELMIVIALMGIMAAIATPALQRYAINRNLKSAARDITSDFMRLKARAIAENRKYRIVFNVPGNNYTIEERNAADTAWINPLIKTPTSFESDIIFTNVAFGAGTTATLEKRGIVTAGTVELTNDRNSTAKITTNITGRTYVDFNMQ